MEVKVRLAPFKFTGLFYWFWVCTSGKFYQSVLKKPISFYFYEKAESWNILPKSLPKN